MIWQKLSKTSLDVFWPNLSLISEGKYCWAMNLFIGLKIDYVKFEILSDNFVDVEVRNLAATPLKASRFSEHIFDNSREIALMMSDSYCSILFSISSWKSSNFYLKYSILLSLIIFSNCYQIEVIIIAIGLTYNLWNIVNLREDLLQKWLLKWLP